MYRKALKLDPRSAIILKNLGTNLLAEHKYNKGWEAYQQALAIDPQIFTDHAGPTVENPSDCAGARRNELLHGAGLRTRRLYRLRPRLSAQGAG